MQRSTKDPVARGLTVSEVARSSGVAPSAVRFYEEHGVLSASRTPGNQRRFGEVAPCLVKIARTAQRVGLSVREIADLFADVPERPGPADWDALRRSLVQAAEERVAQVRAELAVLGSGRELCLLDRDGRQVG